MRALVLAALATSGCSLIADFDDLEPEDGVDPDVVVSGTVFVHGGSGQQSVTIDARDNEFGMVAAGASTLTDDEGEYSLTAPTDFDGYIGITDNDGLGLLTGTYHAIDLFGFSNEYHLTAYSQDRTTLLAMAGIEPLIELLPFARIEVFADPSTPLENATVSIMGGAQRGEQIRYTDGDGNPIEDGTSTVSYTRGVDATQSFAVAYVFGLEVGRSYQFEVQRDGAGPTFNAGRITVQADTIPTVVIFTGS